LRYFDQTVESTLTIQLLSHVSSIFASPIASASLGQPCAKGLLQLGFKKGERIGIWSPNRAEWCITQFATSKIGYFININPRIVCMNWSLY